MRNYEIKTDLHTHTLASTHAYSTLEENCRGAFANGLEGINMSDHGPSMPDAPYEGHFSNMRILPEYIHGVKVWKGAEANIVDYEGHIDLTEHTLGRLECIVASFHEQTFKAGTVEQHTNAYMQALKNPKIHILGHSGTAQYPYDHDTVIKEAARLGKAIELNEATFHVRPSSIANCRKIIAKCKKYGAFISVDSDAHFSAFVGVYDCARKLLDELDFPQEMIINRNAETVSKWLKELAAASENKY